MNESLEQLHEILKRSREEIGKVIVGQQEVIDLSLVTIFSGQHALIEGVPGIAKTLLVRTLAHVLGSKFSRIQFTPDLMPADITGTNVFNLKSHEFVLQPGPVFTTFLLADEINRAPAKTQSALLQAMQERKVSIENQTYSLSPNFSVFATQNPVEFEGTYPLPEAQKDRFMLKIQMDYPDYEDELEIARRMLGDTPPERALEQQVVETVLAEDVVVSVKSTLNDLTIRDELVEYIVKLVRETRNHPSVLVGAGPRATQALLLSSRVLAALQGRDYVSPDDVRFLVKPVMGHRLILRPEYEIEGLSVEETIDRIVEKVAVPR